MPQRFLRPGIRTSGSWNSASFQAQSLYIAIMTLVDDWGRYDGRPALLHGECFALRTNVKRNQTAALLKELHRVGLIQLYEINGKEYLQVRKWQERARGSKSRFPDPPQESAAERSEAQEKDASLALALALAITPSPLHHRHSPNGSQANTSEPTDEEWLLELSKGSAYQGIDVPREYSKLLVWCKTAKKQPSRRRFVNWLNKCERPMKARSNVPSIDPSAIDLPERFKSWAGEKYHDRKDEIMKWQTWADVPGSLRSEWWREEKSKLPISI